MKNIIKKLEEKTVSKELERKIVSKVSQGCISLQRGVYCTSSDITEKLKSLENYSFTKD